jgi:hypothetical protein
MKIHCLPAAEAFRPPALWQVSVPFDCSESCFLIGGFVYVAGRAHSSSEAARTAFIYIDVKKGGTLIEYADEDPHIRKHYKDEMRRNGVASEMPAV